MLRKSGFGCSIFGEFFGAVVYADDNFLPSASQSGLQVMINECQEYWSRINLKFVTNPIPMKSKTKCLVFSRNRKKKENIKNRKIASKLR